jgi:hypothetical protein
MKGSRDREAGAFKEGDFFNVGCNDLWEKQGEFKMLHLLLDFLLKNWHIDYT